MATLEQLCQQGHLVELPVPLGPEEMPWRKLYGTPEFVQWLDQVLPYLPEDPVHADASPLEQVATTFAEYVLGEDMAAETMFRKLRSNPEHFVWELKTDDIRVFGWAPRKDHFICCFGDLADEIKRSNAYGRYIALTVRTRQLLELDEPKVVGRTEYRDVISNQDRC